MSHHLTDETLLLMMDGELPPDQADAALDHLEQCDECLRRRDAFVGLLSEVEVLPPPAAVQADARKSFAQRMATAATSRRPEWLRPRLLWQMAALLVIAAGAGMYRHIATPRQNALVNYEDTGPEPNHAITPGAVSNAELSDLCAMPDGDLDPVVTPEKQRQVFKAYGLDARTARAFQVDYLINPQLGGNDAFENLWPEPYHATVWNAQAKDALETRLHAMVCGGQMRLEDAQRQIATDWIGAYKQIFHADRPVRVQATLVPHAADDKYGDK